ncbi:hypothetical protein Aperf_G00000077653 [Anoplocephala perfoliata]
MTCAYDFKYFALIQILLVLLCSSTRGHGPSHSVSRLIIHSAPELSPANATKDVFSFHHLKNATFAPYPIATLSLPNLPNIHHAVSVLSMYSKGDSKFETYVLEIEGKYCSQGHGHSHGHGHGHSHDHSSNKGTFKEFLYSFLGVSVTNMCALTGVICVPLKRWKHFNYLINFMVGLAVSALFSASVLVLIPESLRLEEMPLEFGGQGFGFLRILGCVPVGLLVVHIIEYFLLIAPRVFNLERSEGVPESESDNGDNVDNSKCGTFKMHGASRNAVMGSNFRFMDIAPVAWMVLLGDSVHNFMDGMAITSGFRVSWSVGLTLTLCVLLEELPHEFGDFAVLITSGFSVRVALCVNFVSACSAYVGMVVGWFVGEASTGAFYVFAGMAGVFLYIGISDMLPSLRRSLERVEKKNKSSLSLFVIQLIGLIVGCLSVSSVTLLGHFIMH